MMAVAVLNTGLLTGCVFAPVAPPRGILYTDQQAPLFQGGRPGSAVGKATAHSILFMVGWGDAGLAAAMRDGNIKELRHTDYRIQNYFLIYQRFTLLAYGETEVTPGGPGGRP